MRSPDVQIADQSPHSRNLDPNSIQAFPFSHLHEDPEPDSSCREELQEGQLAGLPPLDWLSENPTSDIGDRPGILASAARQPGAALIEPSIGDPAELLSQPNAPFLLNFLNSREDNSRQGPIKDSTPGRYKSFLGICCLRCLCYLASICGVTSPYNFNLLQSQVDAVRME